VPASADRDLAAIKPVGQVPPSPLRNTAQLRPPPARSLRACRLPPPPRCSLLVVLPASICRLKYPREEQRQPPSQATRQPLPPAARRGAVPSSPCGWRRGRRRGGITRDRTGGGGDGPPGRRPRLQRRAPRRARRRLLSLPPLLRRSAPPGDHPRRPPSPPAWFKSPRVLPLRFCISSDRSRRRELVDRVHVSAAARMDDPIAFARVVMSTTASPESRLDGAHAGHRHLSGWWKI
jgi:hypothetical protein